jgi:tetratricopeptide (TPR) repeat protein
LGWIPKAQCRRRRLCAFLFLALALGLQTACTGTSALIPEDEKAQLLKELPQSRHIELPVFYPQIEDQCGPASLATMLGHRGLPVTAESLRGKIYIPGKKGTLTTEMVARTRQYGLLPYVLSPSLADVLREVAAGNPVLVMQNLAFDWFPRWHFSIVTGFDLEKEIVIQRSGDERSLETPFQLFDKTWQRADRWAIVISSPDKLPQTAKKGNFLQAAVELELVGKPRAAQKAYLAALESWPGSATALFGAGNTSFTLGEFSRATQLYREYVARHPGSASGWNNLAHSLMRIQCPEESLYAIACAIEIEPENPNFLESRSDLLGQGRPKKPDNPDPNCSIPSR